MKKLWPLTLILTALAVAQEAPVETPKKFQPPKIEDVYKDPEEAEIERTIAVRLNEQQDLWFHDGDYPAVISLLRYEAAVYPFSEDVNSSLGWMLQNVEKRDEEIAVYLNYFHNNPNSPDGPYSAAQFYYLKKDYVMSTYLLAPSIKLKEAPHPNTYRLLAHGYQRLGMLKKSLETWDIYLKLAPGDLTGRRNRNTVAKLLGLPESQSKA